MKIWKIDDESVFESAQEAADHICENNDDVCNTEMYDDMLDECYGRFDIGGNGFYASTILKELDNSVYWSDYDEYKNETEYEYAKELARDLERMSDGDEDCFYGYEVKCIDDEEDEEEEEEETDEVYDIAKVIGF